MRGYNLILPRLRSLSVIALGAACMLAVLLGVAGLVSLIGTADDGAESPTAAPAPTNIGGMVSLDAGRAGSVIAQLPDGWGVTSSEDGLLFLSSPSRCHTATLKAFTDQSKTEQELRAQQMLGYIAGRDFDMGRLWRGTVAQGRGYAVYDPKLLLGVEAVRHKGSRLMVVVHGLPGQDDRCAARGYEGARFELSKLLQGVQAVE
ncbi:MAG: hypothetical protein JHC95_21260 [Solirubrobacteraceae bacterium]|nr:hypothetical protein [Solirubrobacteraceae bacterium]